MSRRLLLLLSISLFMLLCGCASVMRASCGEPRISNRWAPAAYVVKLPMAGVNPGKSVVGKQELDALVSARAMAMAYEVGQVQLTLLDAPDIGECSIAEVYQSVTANSTGAFNRRLFHSAVFVWGDVYDRGGQVYVKLYMRVYWRGRDGAARVVHKGGWGEPSLDFIGRFPSSTISFPRRPLDIAALRGPDGPLDRLQARAKPDTSAPVVAISRHYAITGSERGWLRLTSIGAPEAWVPHEDVDELTSQLLPELDFVQAVVSYITYKVSGMPGAARNSLAALERFNQWPGSAEAALPQAIGNVIAGTLGQARAVELKVADDGSSGPQSGFPVLNAQNALTEELKDVQSVSFNMPDSGYAKAMEQVPFDSDILTLSAMGRITDCCAGPGAAERMRSITAALEAARDIDSANPAAVENLLNWYLLLRRLKPAAASLIGQNIDGRISTLQKIVGDP